MSEFLKSPKQQGKSSNIEKKYTTSDLIELVKEAKGDMIVASIVEQSLGDHFIRFKGGNVLIDVHWTESGERVEGENLIEDFCEKYKDANWIYKGGY